MIGWSAGTLQSSTRSGLVTARRWQSTHICRATGTSAARKLRCSARGRRRADGIQLQRPAGDAQLVEQRGQHLQHFGVAQRAFAARRGRPDDLRADLRELAVAALLRALAAELRADVIELLQLAALAQLVLDVGADHAGGVLGAQGERLRLFDCARARSSQVYISLETMSVSSPTPRAKSAVSSKMGVRISPKL
jgi:hypothetical protein